jgi:hypothetical protein
MIIKIIIELCIHDLQQPFFFFLKLFVLSTLGRMLKFLVERSLKSSSSPISRPFTCSIPRVLVFFLVSPLFFYFYVTISVKSLKIRSN